MHEFLMLCCCLHRQRPLHSPSSATRTDDTKRFNRNPNQVLKAQNDKNEYKKS